MCLTQKDEIVVVASNGKVSQGLHYTRTGEFVGCKGFDGPVVLSACLVGDEIMLLQPTLKSIAFWNITTGDLKKLPYDFLSTSIYHQKLHCFVDSGCYCIEEIIPNKGGVRLTMLKYPCTFLMSIKIDET